MHNRGVVTPTKQHADVDQAGIGFFTQQIHRNLTRHDNVAAPTAALQGLEVDAVELTHRPHNGICSDPLFGARIEQITQRRLGALDCDSRSVHLCKGHHAVEAAFELANVALDALRQKLNHRSRHIDRHLLGLGAQDGNARLVIG